VKLFAKRKAFSLIELLVVITILGILVTVSYPSWSRAAAIRAVEKRNANLRTLNMTGDRLSLNDDGGPTIYTTNGQTGYVTQKVLPGWPLLFPDQPGDTKTDWEARAKDVADYFFLEGYLPAHLQNVIDLEGIGFKYGQFFDSEKAGS
jgi:prepilin-type N-terminal cleavage/methylation domain-containing protein